MYPSEKRCPRCLGAADVSSDVERQLRYATQSLTWKAGDKTEDELLQRIWNLAVEVQRLAARAAGRDNAMREALEAVEWNGYSYIGLEPCPACGQERVKGHAPGCIVRAALDEAGEGVAASRALDSEHAV